MDIAAQREGGLALLQGSHRLPGFERVRETYGEHDVHKAGIAGDGWLSRDPLELLGFDHGPAAEAAGQGEAARWVTADFAAGDVVLFGMHMLHGSVGNQTAETMRLSCDVRFQPAGASSLAPDLAPDLLLVTSCW